MGVKHKLSNQEKYLLIIIEVSGKYINEDDIVVFEDNNENSTCSRMFARSI